MAGVPSSVPLMVPSSFFRCYDIFFTKVPMSSGVGSLVEGEDSDRLLAQVALVSGVTIGPQVM